MTLVVTFARTRGGQSDRCVGWRDVFGSESDASFVTRERLWGIGRAANGWLFAVQRSASASFAPSATNAPAKVRRIQTSTRGREITCWRTAAANNP
jgi:hypothetical protein